MSYRWMSWSEWNDLQEPEKTNVFDRHVLVGGAMLVFDSDQERKMYLSTRTDPLSEFWSKESSE